MFLIHLSFLFMLTSEPATKSFSRHGAAVCSAGQYVNAVTFEAHVLWSENGQNC